MYHDRLWWDLSTPRRAAEMYVAEVCALPGSLSLLWLLHSLLPPQARSASAGSDTDGFDGLDFDIINLRATWQVCNDLGLGFASYVSISRAMKEAIDKAVQVCGKRAWFPSTSSLEAQLL